MDTIKTYQKVNPNDAFISFGISKMEDIYVKRNGRVDEPHRHNFYTVLVVHKANGVHRIDFNEYQMGKEQIYFVAPGQVHQVIEHEQSFGYAMTFSTEFLIENSIPLSFIESLNLFHNYGQSPPLLPPKEQFDKILQFGHEIYALHKSESNMKELSIGAFLKLLLIECNNICAINPLDSGIDSTGNFTLKAFKNLVNDSYKKEHSTSYYAEKLHITPDHLNRIVKTSIGKTAKEYIQTRIITAAKRLLYFSDLSNKEVGFELGFSEPANFSAFFKKCTSLSPTQFRNKEHLS